MVDWGSLADWVGAIGGLLAVSAALVAWRSNERLLSIEKDRDRQRIESSEWEQAELVFAVGAKLPKRDASEAWAIFLYNGSSKPIFDVRIESQKGDGSAPNHALDLGAVPPGRFVIPSHPKYLWGAMVDLSLAPEPVEFLVKGNGAKVIQSVAFTDSARRNWRLDGGRQLSLKK